MFAQPMRVIIIDQDERQAVALSKLLNVIDKTTEVVTVISSVQDAVRWLINKPACDLIFMDVELSDGSSFDIFREVSVITPVIFTTATADYALKSFKLNCIDYLIKPIEKNGLIAAIYKFKNLGEQFTSQQSATEKELVSKSLAQPEKAFKSRFVVTLGDKIKYIPSVDIAWFKAEGNIVYLHTFDKHKFIIDHSLEEIGDSLDHCQFFRINRTFLCQITAIVEIRKYFNSRLKIYLSPEPDDDEVLVSRNRVQEFLNWLGR